MKKVLTLGELLLRVSPDPGSGWLNSNTVPIFPGGAELNVASALGRWGLPVSYFTAVPDNFLSKQILHYIAAIGVDISSVIFRGSRLGLYYLSQGKDLKNAEVVYDRTDSAFAGIQPGSISWEKVFDQIDWFHFSAICPSLNSGIAAVCLEALEYASRKKITISLDLNYRAKLWQYGKSPLEVMPALAKYCDVIMGNIWSAQTMLGIPSKEFDFDKTDLKLCVDQARFSSMQIIGEFPVCNTVANTFRIQDTKGTKYFATIFKDGKMYTSQEHLTGSQVYSVGTGDCFMAGLIYGIIHQLPTQEILEFATAAAFDKFFSPGDATLSSIEQIEKRIS